MASRTTILVREGSLKHLVEVFGGVVALSRFSGTPMSGIIERIASAAS